MKLLNYTTIYFSAILLVLISIWAVVFYYAMFDEIYDSIDDGLDNRKMVLIERASQNLDFLERPILDEYLYRIEKVDFNKYRGFKDTYKDTVMYMMNEEDYEPVRTLESIFKNNNEYYKITVATSMVEEDDQIQNLLQYTLILYAVLVISILLLNNFFLRKVWKPFYNLIAQLKTFSLENNKSLKYTPTKIEEFQLLNHSIEKLLLKTSETFSLQKQFIENASHELQTPLAIAINKLEMFFEETQLSEHQASQLQQALENLERLTRLNRSLLLISKIENDQFQEKKQLDLSALVQEIISNFSEMAEHRNMDFEFSPREKVFLNINPDLAHFLFSNLLKNAIAHGKPGSRITVSLTENSFAVGNFSETPSLENKVLFERFRKHNSQINSTGLGLAISHSIASKYGFTLAYSYNDARHWFRLNFS